MTNGEKFKEVFGFGADGSRVIAVNSTWWDCEFQNSKSMSDELVKRLRDAATMSEALAILLPHSEGNVTAKLYKEAADTIETLHDAYTESFSVIEKAFRNNPKDLVLKEYMMKNACCCEAAEGE